MRDETLVVLVTRNNPVLLEHVVQGYMKYKPGTDMELLIVDNSSDDQKQLRLIDRWQADGILTITAPNNRVEASFDHAYKKFPDYKYYFFVHDDCRPNKDNWLKKFVDRVEGNFYEDIIKDTNLKDLPIGKVGACSQYWRSYTSVLNYPVQCTFLKKVLDVVRPGLAPEIFKYCDNDRSLVKNGCLKATDGLFNLSIFKKMEKERPDLYKQVCEAVNSTLPYADEGIPPRDIYPAGECWNKLTMISEFMTSVEPLINGYRVVGLQGDGYLEQIHGYDTPFGHEYIHHYGSPNMKQFLAKYFKTDPNEVSKHFNNKVMLMKFDKIIEDHFQ